MKVSNYLQYWKALGVGAMNLKPNMEIGLMKLNPLPSPKILLSSQIETTFVLC